MTLIEDLCLIFSVNDDEDLVPNDYTADMYVTNSVFCCQSFPYIVYHLHYRKIIVEKEH